ASRRMICCRFVGSATSHGCGERQPTEKPPRAARRRVAARVEAVAASDVIAATVADDPTGRHRPTSRPRALDVRRRRVPRFVGGRSAAAPVASPHVSALASQPTARPSSGAAAAVDAIRRWGERCDWRGYDPYDGLSSPLAPFLTLGTRGGRRVLTQVVKQCPVNLRPLLRIRPAWNSKALAL